MIRSRRVARIGSRRSGLWPALDSVWAVEERIAAGTRFRRSTVPRLTLAVSESGTITDILDRANPPRIAHTPRGLSILPPNAVYREFVDPAGDDWHVWYIMLRGPWAAAFSRAFAKRFDRARPTLFAVAPQSWRRAVREATRLALDQPAGWQWPFLSHLASVLGEILAAPTQSSDDDDDAAALARRARALVDADPHRPWPVPELARSLGVADSTLAHRFRAATGTSPALWIRRRRIDAAKHLLTQGMSVVEASKHLGFANPYHFSRVFKDIAGIAPSEARGGKRARWLH